MNPFLIHSGLDQCFKFASISDDDLMLEIASNKDLIIGKNYKASLEILNGQTAKVRDIVVLGSLTIQSKNKGPDVEKGHLLARNIFTAESLTLTNNEKRTFTKTSLYSVERSL